MDQERETELATVDSSNKPCGICKSSNTVRYSLKELYRTSYCYSCKDCDSFAVEEANSFTLSWQRNKDFPKSYGRTRIYHKHPKAT